MSGLSQKEVLKPVNILKFWPFLMIPPLFFHQHAL